MDYKVYMHYSAVEHGGDICEGMEDAEWPDYEPIETEFTFKGIYTQPNHQWDEEIEVDFDPDLHMGSLWTVIVRYTTGGTFQTCYGSWRVIKVCTDKKDAEQVIQSIVDGTYDGYKFWEGYFESLESVDMHESQLYFGICPPNNWS
jgi:hypothetical protein